MYKPSKNILFLTPGFPADENDSTCIPALQDFIKGLRLQEPDLAISIISLHYPEQKNVYHWQGCKVYALGAANCKFPKRYYYWRALKSQVLQLHQREPFDLIHGFWFDEVTYVVNEFKHRLSIPIYCTFMGQEGVTANRYSKRIDLPEGNLVALSDFQHKDIVSNLGIKPAHLIPWATTNHPTSFDKTIDLINIGWFNELKNQKESIAILAQVQKVYPHVKMIFIGEGALLDQCQSQVKKLSLANNVQFTGLIPREEVFDLLSKSRILIHSSHYESFGMIFPEAISAQTMIVSKRVGIAKEEPWWKIYSTVDQAVSQIKEFLEHPVYPSKDEKEQFSVQNTVEKYLTLWGTKKGRT